MKEERASLLFGRIVFDFSENDPESAESIGEEDDWHESQDEPEEVEEAKNLTSLALVSVFLDETCVYILWVFVHGIADSPAEDKQNAKDKVTCSEVEKLALSTLLPSY